MTTTPMVPEDVVAVPGLAPAATTAAALFSVGAGAVHLAAMGQHAAAWPLAGAFFGLAAVFGVGWAAAAIRRPGRAIFRAGVAGHAAVLATWVVSRTTGIPFGPHAGVPELVGPADAAATLLAAGAVAAALVLLRALRRTAGMQPVAARGPLVVAALAIVLTAVGVAGGGGHGRAGVDHAPAPAAGR